MLPEPFNILEVEQNTLKPKACVRVFKHNVICVELFMGPVCLVSDRNVGCSSIELEYSLSSNSVAPLFYRSSKSSCLFKNCLNTQSSLVLLQVVASVNLYNCVWMYFFYV